MTIISKKKAAAELVPFPAEFPPDPDSEADMIALLTKEYDEHAVRTQAMWDRIAAKRRDLQVCASGTNPYLRSSMLPEMDDRYDAKAPVEVPAKGNGNEHYDHYTMQGLHALRERRLAAWRRQMAGFRAQVMRAENEGHIRAVTRERIFTEFGLAPPRLVTRNAAVIYATWDTPEGQEASDTQAQKAIQEALEPLTPGAQWVSHRQYDGTNSYVQVSHHQVQG